MTHAFEQLILDIHAAPSASRWSEVLERIALRMNSHRSLMFSMPTTTAPQSWVVLDRLPTESFQEYARHWIERDLWRLGALERGRIRPGDVNRGEELVDQRVMLTSAFFNDFLVHHDFGRYISVPLCAGDVADGSPPMVTSWFRPPGAEPFSEQDARLLGALAPHLVIASRTTRQLARLADHASLAKLALDCVAAPLMGIDRLSRVLLANAAAERMLASRTWLRLERGALVAASGVEPSRAVASALHGVALGRASTLVLTNTAQADCAILGCMPLSPSTFSPNSRAAGLVWILPPSDRTLAARQLSRLFGLTPAERRLLERFARGASLADIAESMGITGHTARVHLKSIFRRTRWNSQLQLTAILERLAGLSTETATERPCGYD